MRVFSNSKRKSLRRGAWRQGICVLLSVLLLFSVTACGKKNSAGTEGAESGSTGAEAGQAAPGGNSTGNGKEAASAAQTGEEIEIPEKPRKTEDGGISMDVFAMDTYMTLLAYGDQAEEAVLAAAAEIHRLDDLLSTGNPESEISTLNAAGGGTISADVEELISRAKEIHAQTGGLFDISIYPVMKLWGFPTQEFRVPDKTEIEETLKLVDAAQITVTEVPAAGQAQTAAPSEGAAPAAPAEGSDPASAQDAAPADAAAAPAETAPAESAESAAAPAEESAPAPAPESAPAETAPAADGSAEATGEVGAPATVEAQAAAPQKVYVKTAAAENAETAPAAEETAPAAAENTESAAGQAAPAAETPAADAAAPAEETTPAAEAPAADAAAPEADAAAPEADAAAPAETTPAAQTPSAEVTAPAAENAGQAQTAATAPAETEKKVSFGITGMEIDLGGIAKGYTSSRVMDIFREYGIKHGLVSLGGNVQAIGTKKNGKPWRVAIQNPESEMEYLGVLNIEDKCVITSGGYERYFEKDGVHYHHIIDPRTGYPADSGLISATIISDDGALADGLSTSLFIMGKDEAEKYWREHADDFDYILEDEDGTLYVTEGADEILTTDNRTIVIRK